MSKQILKNYTFVAVSRTITLTDLTTVRLDRLQLITDVTTNVILYNFADSTVATATVATNVITLSTVGTAASTDKLQIIYDVLSTDPVAATDPLLGAATITPDVILQNAAIATGVGTNLSVTGYGTALVQLSGTFVASVTFEVSSNAGTTWDPISATKIGTSIISPTTTTAGQYRITVAGFDLLRANVTWTSGTSITAIGRATNAVNSSKIVVLAPSANVIGKAGIDQTTPGTTNLVAGAGIYNSTLPTLTTGGRSELQVDSSGRLQTTFAPLLNTIDSVTNFGASTEQASLTSGALGTDLVLSTDISIYKSFSLQVLGTWVGTLTVQGSNDNTNWINANALGLGSSVAGASAAIVSNNIYVGPLGFRYLRVRMTAYTSGTATGTLEVYSAPAAMPSQGMLAAQSGTWTVQPGNTPNTVAWKVDGSAVTQPVSGGVTNAGVVGAVTTFTAADIVVAAPDGTGTLVSGTSTAGSITTAFAVADGLVSSTFLIKGLTASQTAITIYFESSTNSTNGIDGDWIEVKQRRTGTQVGVESADYKTQANGYFRGNCAGFRWLRARLLGTFTGTPSAQIFTSAGMGATFLNSGIPGGNSIIGKVGIDQTTPGTTNLVAISGTVPVSLATAPTTPVTGTFFQATQPISAVALPLPTGAALDVTSTNGTQQTKITDGTNVANTMSSTGTVAGNNSVLVAPAVQTLTFTTSTAGAQTLLANTDISHYSWIEVVFTSMGAGVALAGVFSTASAGTYVISPSFAAAGALAGNIGTSTGIPYVSPIRGNFFQLAVSAITSGTLAGTVTLRTTPNSYDTMKSVQSGAWSIGATTPTNAAMPTNVFAMGTSDGTLLQALRGNEAVTLLASAARTVTATSADLINFNGASVIDVILDMTVVGTGSVTVTVNGKDPASGKYYLLLAGAAIVANSTNVYTLNPSLATAVANVSAQKAIPRIFQIVVTANNANTATYSVGYNLMRG